MVSGTRPLILIGAGGLGREAAEALRAINAARPTWSLLGYLDDDPAKRGRLAWVGASCTGLFAWRMRA